LIFLLSFLFFLFLIAFFVFRSFEKRTLVLLFEKTAQDKEAVFDNILTLRGKSLETLAFDYTYWDELVEFIKSSDNEWGKNNLDTCLDTYDTNIVWVFKLDYALRYSVNDLKDDTLSQLPLFKGEGIFKKFFAEENRFCHFFINTEKGVMEIRGATVHPSTDSERKTAPVGYFFTGRLWGQEYISELSKLTESKMRILSFTDRQSVMEKSNLQNGVIAFSRVLTAWDGSPLKKLSVWTISSSINDFNQRSKQYLFLNLLFSLLIIGVFAIFTLSWIGSPLRLISNTLKTENLSYIMKLQEDKTEFGDISRLIANFFSQKNELSNEIGHRMKIESDLISSKESFHNIVERSNDGIIVTDSDKIVRFVNLAAESFLGGNGLLGKNFIYPVVPGAIEEIEILRNGKDKGVGEMRVTETQWDRNIGYLISILDITKQKEIEKQQRLAELGKLVADMAHEVNNPLMVISGNAQVALMEHIENQDLKNNLELMLQESLRAKNIIQRLLKFSRPSKGLLKEVDIHKSIDEIIALLERQFNVHGIEIRREYVKNPPLLILDEHQLQEVFVNLFNNAREAMPKGGVIEISSSLEEEYLKIDFKDTGIGIPQEIIGRIFEPFFTTKEKGTGLGLPLCYGIIKSYNGDLEITSVSGQGTTISILLPLKGVQKNA
jgi:signal transduction histidine kinase